VDKLQAKLNACHKSRKKRGDKSRVQFHLKKEAGVNDLISFKSEKTRSI